eukprot:1175639-Prorocentrum_minimum.AAC.8
MSKTATITVGKVLKVPILAPKEAPEVAPVVQEVVVQEVVAVQALPTATPVGECNLPTVILYLSG